MFIDPSLIKSTTFLVQGAQYIGTVFFVRVPLGDSEADIFGNASYAVTAGHCVDELGVSIRWPLGSGKPDTETLGTEWIRNDDVDLAIYPLAFDPRDYGMIPIPLRECIEDSDYLLTHEIQGKVKRALQYGEGDEVFTIGLFENDYGPRANQPVVRFGHIALRPGPNEKVTIKNRLGEYPEVDAILVEMALWKGQSGSPIFLRPWIDELKRHGDEESGEITLALGVAQGFHFGKQKVGIGSKEYLISGMGLGIGVVIPAKFVVKMLMSDEQKTKRNEALKNKPSKG